MPDDRNALLGVLAVRRGWVQPAEVVAARQALKGSLAAQLGAMGALTAERVAELEKLADAALAKSGGNASKAIADNGGQLPPPQAGRSFGDDDTDERTSIKLDLDAPAPVAAAKGFDEEDEPTKVLDWDRAMKKSLDKKLKKKFFYFSCSRRARRRPCERLSILMHCAELRSESRRRPTPAPPPASAAARSRRISRCGPTRRSWPPSATPAPRFPTPAPAAGS